jgi:cation diffusion facilitator family transporter
MALLADGVHMSTHAGALTIAALAYRYARRHQHDERFAFGTGKVGDLAGFASALGLGLIALLIAAESVARLLHPVRVAFNEAILVAVVGLLVNLVSAALLMHPHEDGGDHDDRDEHKAHHDDDNVHDNVVDHVHGQEHGHEHGHRDDHAHAHHHADHNLIAAYVHVLADAVTSVLAIIALTAGRYLGWVWLDAAMGLVGSAVIMRWSYTLMRQTGRVLLDSSEPSLHRRVITLLEQDDARVADLHIWRLGPGHSAVIASVVCASGREPGHFKARLRALPMLSHVTIEVHHHGS